MFVIYTFITVSHLHIYSLFLSQVYAWTKYPVTPWWGA